MFLSVGLRRSCRRQKPPRVGAGRGLLLCPHPWVLPEQLLAPAASSPSSRTQGCSFLPPIRLSHPVQTHLASRGQGGGFLAGPQLSAAWPVPPSPTGCTGATGRTGTASCRLPGVLLACLVYQELLLMNCSALNDPFHYGNPFIPEPNSTSQTNGAIKKRLEKQMC